MKKITYEYVKNFIESEGYHLLSDSYINSKEKLLVKCQNNHTYKVRFNSFKSGRRCIKCFHQNSKKRKQPKIVSNQKKKLSYQIVKNFIESEGYQLLSDTYINNRTKLLLKCPIGHEYEATFNSFQYGNRCSICNGKHKHSYDYVKNFIESQGYQLLSESYKNARTKLLLKCPIGHEYKVTFVDFKCGSRCSTCSGNKKFTYDYVKNYIESQGYQLLSKSYKNSVTRLLVKCPIGHEYKVTFGNFQKGIRCQQCYFKSTSSKGEQDLAFYVESLGIPIIRNDRNTIVSPLTGYNLELDIYIPSLNKAIEYNGEYWHSDIIRDEIKAIECEKLNIDLLIVKDYNWINNRNLEMEKVKNWLIKIL